MKSSEKIQLEFIEGFIFINKSQHLLVPINTFLCLFSQIDTLYSQKDLEKILLNITKLDSQFFFNNFFEKKISTKKNIERYLSHINSLGFGEIKFITRNNDRFLFQIDKLKISKLYFQIFNKKTKLPIESILIFFIYEYLKLINSSNIEYNIIEKNLRLNVSFNLLKEDYFLDKKKIITYPNIKKNSFSLSSILKKVIINKNIKIKDGIFSLWKTLGILPPFYFLFGLSSNLDKENFSSIFYDLGVAQAMVAINIQKNLFGLEGEKLFNQVFGQTDLGGGGIYKLIEENENVILYIENDFRDHFLDINSYDLDLFYRYLETLIISLFAIIKNKELHFVKKEKSKIIFKKTGLEFKFTKKQKDLIKILSIKKSI